MKNIINYFYGIKINNEITTEDNCNFYFKVGKNYYCFSRLSILESKRISELYSNYIVSPNFHSILTNKNKSVFTFNNENCYILMKITYQNKIITHDEFFNYHKQLQRNGLMFNYRRVSWATLWRRKIDYLEYYVQENQSINNNVKCLCNYFIGISESAISLINLAMSDYSHDFEYEQVTLCHDRIRKNYTLYDLYNPKNIILDHYSRDVSEYLKSFIFGDNYDDIIEIIIDKTNFTNVGYILLLARTMFPTFFYDCLNDIDESSFNDEKIIKMYDLVSRYENLISKLYFLIRKKIQLPHIEWLLNLD